MKKKLLNSMRVLLVAALLGGASSAWAAVGDVTTQANIDFSNAISSNAVAGTVNSMALSGNFELGYTSGDPATTTLGDVLRVGNGTGTVTIADADLAGTRDEVVITFDMYFGSLSGKSAGFYLYDNAEEPAVIGGLYISKYSGTEAINSFSVDKTKITAVGSSSASNAKICEATNKTTFEVHLNYATGTMYLLQYTNGTLKQTTAAVAMGSTKPLKKFVVQSNYNNGDRRCWFDNLLIQTKEGDYTVSSANYTVNWVCGGTTVKTATRTGDAGTTITLLDTDDDSFTVDETRYMYVSDDAEGKTVAGDGSTVVTITVKEPAVYNYSIKAVDADENILSTLASSSVTEDDNSVTTPLPWYVLKDGTLYYQDKNSNTTSITSDNQVVNITYAANKTNIVYYVEAEEIGTAQSANGSNGQAARGLSNVKVTTLEAGKYKIYSRFIVGNGLTGDTYATNPFTVGETALVYNVPARANTDYTSEEFNVIESTDLYVTFSGSSSSGVDYIYIQRTGDAATTIEVNMSPAGWATLYTPYALDFTTQPGITAYTAAVADGKVTLTKVDNVPANTGVVLKGDGPSFYQINVAASSETAKGDLLGSATDATAYNAIDGYTLYMLKKVGEKAQFVPVTASSIAAGKAYLKVANATTARNLDVTFADEATGIESVKSEEIKVKSEVYNLKGQRVSEPTKGLYIVNGKKIAIK